MKTPRLTTAMLAACLLAGSGWALADDRNQDRDRDRIEDRLQDRDQDRDGDRDRDRDRDRVDAPIFGSQLMTEQERAEHRLRMRSAKSFEERERIRQEHHERMKARAKERGVTLPDDPPPRGAGRGMGPGGGMGSGPRY